MDAPWPTGFARVPDADWTRAPVDTLAVKYDRVENHGWYANLDLTVDEIAGWLADGDVLVDYSGGTGILIDRLLARRRGAIGIVNVDSSPKFLRLSLEKFRAEPRVAFRLLAWLKNERRLQLLEEALDRPLVGGLAGLASANAIHLYYDLDDTLASWARCLRPGGRAFVQSGNVANPHAPPGSWIIDDTVEAVHAEAARMVQADPRWAAYRAPLADAERMSAHDAFRRKVFLPPRPLAHYVDAFERAGFRVLATRAARIRARQSEWRQFLSVYHEAVLGWVGGIEKVEGRAAAEPAVRDRLDLLAAALDRVLGGREEFDACWTYLTLERP